MVGAVPVAHPADFGEPRRSRCTATSFRDQNRKVLGETKRSPVSTNRWRFSNVISGGATSVTWYSTSTATDDGMHRPAPTWPRRSTPPTPAPAARGSRRRETHRARGGVERSPGRPPRRDPRGTPGTRARTSRSDRTERRGRHRAHLRAPSGRDRLHREREPPRAWTRPGPHRSRRGLGPPTRRRGDPSRTRGRAGPSVPHPRARGRRLHPASAGYGRRGPRPAVDRRRPHRPASGSVTPRARRASLAATRPSQRPG